MTVSRKEGQTSGNGNREERRKGKDPSPTEEPYEWTGNVYGAWADFYHRMTEESLDFFQRSLEHAQHYAPNPLNPADPKLANLWDEGFQTFMEQLGEDGFPRDPAQYHKFYQLWMTTWSKGFEAYMSTPEFIQASGKNLEAMSEVKSRLSEMMEQYWHHLHLPSLADMREIYHKFYTIERKLDAHERKLDELYTAVTAVHQQLDTVLNRLNPVSERVSEKSGPIKSAAKYTPRKTTR